MIRIQPLLNRLLPGLALALLAMPQPAAAAFVSDCDWRARADAIVEPWEENTRTFSKGAVRVALIDTIEPAAVPFYLLILSPPYDELGARQCRLVGFQEGIGFANLDFSALTAAYDPARGLTVSVPGGLFVPDQNFYNGLLLHVTINQSTGEISTATELGNE